jgi:hypothetical protein
MSLLACLSHSSKAAATSKILAAKASRVLWITLALKTFQPTLSMSLRAEKMRAQKVLNEIETKSDLVDLRTRVEGLAGCTPEHGD